jgi:hypothetical protein
MALHTFNVWQIALGGAQIGLCGLILLFLVRNRSRHKQMIFNAPADQNAPNFNTEFVVEAIRQQTQMAFDHILDTIDKERHSLEACFELRELHQAPRMSKSPSSGRKEAVAARGAAELDAADAIYDEIENLAGQGMSLTDISQKLDVPPGEVDLVLKLKHLSTESAKKKSSYGSA